MERLMYDKQSTCLGYRAALYRDITIFVWECLRAEPLGSRHAIRAQPLGTQCVPSCVFPVT